MKDTNDGYKFTHKQAILCGICVVYIVYLFGKYGKPFPEWMKVFAPY